MPDDPAAGTSFTTLVGMTIPGTEVQGSVLGVYRHDGREELVVPVDAALVCHRNERCHSVTPILSKSGMTILSTTSPGRVSSLAT